MREQVLAELENTKFPKTYTRKNISNNPLESFVLGDVNYRGQKFLGGRTRGPSRFNRKFPDLLLLLQKFMKSHNPYFKYTTIQLNKNITSPPHIDKNNVGPSYIIALGDYSGGDLCIKGKPCNIKNRWKKFNGTEAHWTEPFKGTRYSLVFLTHTFKPPNASLRNLKVTKKGIYKNRKLIEIFE